MDKSSNLPQHLKILFVSDTARGYWNGVVRSILELMNSLPNFLECEIKYIHPDFGNNTTTISKAQFNNFSPVLVVNDFPVISSGLFRIRTYVDWADLIIVHETAALSVYSLIWAKLRQKEAILWYHVDVAEMVYSSITIRPLALPASKIAQLIRFCISKLAKKHVHFALNSINENENDKYVFPFCLNYSKFNRFPSTNQMREKLGVSENALCVGYVGRLAREKNVECFYEIAQLMLNLFTEVFVICVGQGSITPPNSLMINDDFLWIRETDQIEVVMNALDIIMLFSDTETGPFVILEAMACGAVPMCRPVGVCADLIEHERCGFLLKAPTQPEIREETLNYLRELYNNHNKLAYISKNAERRVRSYCPDWEQGTRYFCGNILSAS